MSATSLKLTIMLQSYFFLFLYIYQHKTSPVTTSKCLKKAQQYYYDKCHNKDQILIQRK